jgi:hypothetical protein
MRESAPTLAMQLQFDKIDSNAGLENKIGVLLAFHAWDEPIVWETTLPI